MSGDLDLSFVVVGAQKAGSTAVAGALSRHPEVFVPDREVPLFERDLFTTANRRAVASLYRGHPERHHGLKRPDLLLDEQAPERIADLSERVVAIAVLRDPVARAVSAYWWYLQAGLLPALPPDVGLAGLLEAHRTGTTDARWPRAHEVLGFGRYGEGLARYRAALGIDRLLVILPADLDDGTWRERVRVRLGLATPPGPLERENPGVFSLRRARWLARRRPLLADATSPDYHAERSRLLHRVGATVARGMNVVDRSVLARVWDDGDRDPGPEVMAGLRAHYHEDRRLLVDTIERDVGWP